MPKHKTTAALFLFAACVGISGCAPLDRNELKTRMSAQTMKVGEGYQPIYRRLLDQSRRCHQASGFFGPIQMVQGDLYTDTQVANISLLRADGGYVYTVDIKANSPDSSIISIYADDRYLGGSLVPVIQTWISGQNDCRP